MGASTNVGILSNSPPNQQASLLTVALPVPLRENFSYLSPENTEISVGCRVRVSFGPRELVGLVVGTPTHSELPIEKIKPIIEALDTTPLFPLELLHLCQWGANYYYHAFGEVLSAAMPKHFREGKAPAKATSYRHTSEGLGLNENALKRAPKQQAIHQFLLEHTSLSKAELEREDLSKSALNSLIDKQLIEPFLEDDTSKDKRASAETAEQLLKEVPLTLNTEQNKALEAILYHRYTTYLIEGVTGSGKTEVYMQAIARVLQAGAQALVMIPEIGLSAQTINRLRARFNVPIAELHSDVAEGQRAKNWIDAREGKAKIVVGTRLASLCPFKNLGIIIIDEEHDRSYKQQDGIKYSARDLSIYRAHTLNIPIVLGSATPSLESYFNAQNNKYQHLELKQRAGSAQLPKTTLVDLKTQHTQAGLSEQALHALANVIAKDEQALVFVNRRGFASALLCHQCGWHAQCRSCDARMTFHQKPYALICHHCERKQYIPKNCPNCGQNELATSGLGTEQIETNLNHLFPETSVVRIDRDSTSAKQSLSKLLAEHKDAGACLYVGTQMLAKGHHLERLTLAIIVDADQGFMSPDFRSVEQMGQLLVQVAGRPGRAEKPGEVMIQSHFPEHPLLQPLREQNYSAFASALMQQRHTSSLPPFSHSTLFRAENKRAENCIAFLSLVKKNVLNLQQISRKNKNTQTFHPIQIIGPLPSFQEKVNDRYRFCLQLYSPNRAVMKSILDQLIPLIEKDSLAKRIRWSVDVDNVVSA
ncbi:MAG: primosomal protein N' [Agarilytica sp.]